MAKNLLDGTEVRSTVEKMRSGTVAQCVRAGGGGVAQSGKQASGNVPHLPLVDPLSPAA